MLKIHSSNFIQISIENIAVMIFVFQNKLFISKVWINLPNDQGKETFWAKLFT
ncbi:hypothetical protein [Campylobacter sp. RM16187]|uniref:hypothetical protein n=1 Tax=Campylobacter sp. RM16187 TaxID=1660063 RepID=UPI0021B669D8|nr:hypothetical protein [Campylobacter sp. RM16187]